MADLSFHRAANSPAVPLDFVDAAGAAVDLTGSVVEILVRATRTAEPVALRSDGVDPALSIVPPGRVTVSYSEAFVVDLVTGAVGRWDAYRLLGAAREWLGGGRVVVHAAGEGDPGAAATVVVPGLQGPPGEASPEFQEAHDEVIAFRDAVYGGPKTIAATAYTLLAADWGARLRFPNGCVVTLPAELDPGFFAVLARAGEAAVTWIAGAGASLHATPAGTGIAARYASVTVAVDENVGGGAAVWWVEGAIS